MRTLNHQIVDAHRDQVDANGVVFFGGACDRKLGPDAVGTGDQNRIFEACCLGVEERAKTADAGHRSRAVGRLGKWLDRVDQGGASINVNAGVLVAQSVAVNTFFLRTNVLDWVASHWAQRYRMPDCLQ